MTGFGEARHRDEQLCAAVEIRAINNRYFKISTRTSEGYGGLEPQIEAAVRRHVNRGTVQVNVSVARADAAAAYALNEEVLDSYRKQLEGLHKRWHVSESVPLESLLSLPGAVNDQTRMVDADQAWPVVEKAVNDALQHLDQMRKAEGEAMAADLLSNLDMIAGQLTAIEQRAPQVVESYRQRLTERINKLLGEYEISVEPADLVREVGLFAERSDICEEIVRLRSHLVQFRETMELPEGSGRRLEFLTQEMFRETNTIGSKSNDSEISHHVIEIKALIERIREMIQNVE
jgi:uncharacterized protein (TIGR00255 family)